MFVKWYLMWELFYHMAFHAVIVFGFCYSFLSKSNLIIHIYLNTNINICGRNWECDFQWSGSSALLTPPLSLHCPHTTFLKTVHTVYCKLLTWPAWAFQAWPLTVPQQSVVSHSWAKMTKTRQKLDFKRIGKLIWSNLCLLFDKFSTLNSCSVRKRK